MNEVGRITKSVYNAKGQLAQTINPDGKATTYTYNAEGQRTKVETPNGATFTFSYDSLQRVTAKGNPDRGETTYSYDVSGNILTETNAKGEVKSYAYDISNRKISTSYSTDASLNESYEYDQGANAKGLLTKITDSSGSTEFAYDVDNHLVSKTQTIANQRFTTSYTYDEHDRMTSKTYPSGKVVGYMYDDKGELMSLNIGGVPFIGDIQTNDNGLLSYTYADGTKHTRTYDENGRVKELNYPNYIEKVNYNKVSNITNIQSDAMSRAFGYDNLDRLTSYEQNATDFQNFAYDANGNRLSQSQEENSSKTFDYLANSNILNTIQETKGTATTAISYEYDATGNIIKDDKHTYSYDGRNRLTAIDNNVTYQYNYDNKRVSKTVNGVKTYFIYDGHMLIGEYQLNLSDQSRQEMVYLNSTPIATVTPTGTYRIYSDHLDTSRRVATNNQEAEVLWEWESKPFGESLADEDVDQNGKEFTLNLRFPGQYFDAETKTHYNINRDYNPVTGRYIQSDPIGFDGGVNGFGYVGGQPILYKDCNGLTTCNQWVNHLTDLWDNHAISYSLGYYMVMNRYDSANYLTETLTGFKPVLLQGGQNAAMGRHIYGHAGARLSAGIVGDLVSRINIIIDYLQYIPGNRDDETTAEIADDYAATATADIMQLAYDSYWNIWDWRTEDELIYQYIKPKLTKVFCK